MQFSGTPDLWAVNIAARNSTLSSVVIVSNLDGKEYVVPRPTSSLHNDCKLEVGWHLQNKMIAKRQSQYSEYL